MNKRNILDLAIKLKWFILFRTQLIWWYGIRETIKYLKSENGLKYFPKYPYTCLNCGEDCDHEEYFKIVIESKAKFNGFGSYVDFTVEVKCPKCKSTFLVNDSYDF